MAFLQWVDLIGVLFNAMLGAVIARGARMDIVAFMVLGIMTGLGGGMIRDTLLQVGPPIAITDWRYLTTALAGCGIVALIHVPQRWWDRIWPPIDAIAVGAWAAAGTMKTLEHGFGVLPALMLGTITAVGGGFVRDVVLRRIPGILGGNTLYAVPAILASGVAVVFHSFDLTVIGSLAAIFVGASTVLLARWKKLVLPAADADITLSAALRRAVRRSQGEAGWRPRFKRDRDTDPAD